MRESIIKAIDLAVLELVAMQNACQSEPDATKLFCRAYLEAANG